MHGIDLILDLSVILAGAALAGWLCRQIRVSVVVGFMLAGILVGPHTEAVALIQDLPRIQMLAQVGLVFLMFSIGLRLSLRKLRRLGVGMILGVLGAFAITYHFSRLLGLILGYEGPAGIFFASLFVVSSSAIVSKVLSEVGTTHERAGQLALGVTLIEGILAIGVLTLLNTYVTLGSQVGRPALGITLGQLGAFVVLAGIAGLLIVPWLLRRVGVAAGEELQTIGVAALLLALAAMTYAAGYSLALGSLLLGVIVSETPQRFQIERSFEGVRDLFTAVFFVAVGLQIDVGLLWQHALPIIAISVFVVLVRVGATTTSLALVGMPPRDAFRAGLMVAPIGEFSFLFAQLGVVAVLVPAELFPISVGVSLLTSLAASALARRGGDLTQWVAGLQPAWLSAWGGYYRDWIDRIQARRSRNLLWQLSKKRLVQILVSAFFVTGLLVFAERLHDFCQAWLGRDLWFPDGLRFVFWSGLFLVVLAPLVAIWRNASAMALLYSQVATRGMPRKARIAPVIETGLKLLAGGVIVLWLSSLLPTEGTARWLLVWMSLLAVGALYFLRRRLVHWHSELEVELQERMTEDEARPENESTPWLRPYGAWNLSVSDCILPDLAECQGKRIDELALRSRFGCTVVGIERQGHMISLPGPEAVLYPRDKVLLLGTSEQLEAGKQFLTAVSGTPPALAQFDDVRMELIHVPRWSRAVGIVLSELDPTHHHQVQIAGIHRRGVRILTPRSDHGIESGDQLLALGAPEHLRAFKDWVNEEAGEEIADA
ncbi:MAG TPA: cation:proton antiporter [Opitutaceae bacterium]|jgi:CPA2 family monovalent cation:H+ antiporter-2|nr:cation:proton antiporter [Opitutaceae bacterium]